MSTMKESKGVVWDLTSFFPEFNGPEMKEFKEALKTDLQALRERASKLDVLSKDNMADWESLICEAEELGARAGHIFSFVGCLSACDSANEEYNREQASLYALGAEFSKFDVDILRGLKESSDELFEEFVSREKLAPVAHMIRRDRIRAQQTMSREEEILAADLGVDGFHAWGRLYDTISGKLEFDMEYPDGRKEKTPISQWRALMSHSDREIGKAAFEGGNKAWETIEDTCAAALNAISGTRHKLNEHRGIDYFLDKALFQSSIEKETLDAMYKAIHDNIEIARDIFRIKAGHMGRKGINWWEREAPLPFEDNEVFTWERGRDMVSQAFETAYPDLAEYYKGMLDKNWIESEVRPGKRPGAFCTGSEVTREQRVYMTFNGALGDVSTLAHEVGHAWHGHLLKDMRPGAQSYPMTLAETASIFAEQILSEGIANDPNINDMQKLKTLDGNISDAAVNLLDITVRFEWEKAFYEERLQGEVSVSRMKELMVETQRKVWGDAMEEGGEDPMFWASKLHFYITGVSFYNFPYTFGFLLAKALAGMFREQGAAFLPKYEEFLRLTGSDTAENVAKRALGVDLKDPEFWAASIKGLEEPLKQYKELLEKL